MTLSVRYDFADRRRGDGSNALGEASGITFVPSPLVGGGIEGRIAVDDGYLKMSGQPVSAALWVYVPAGGGLSLSWGGVVLTVSLTGVSVQAGSAEPLLSAEGVGAGYHHAVLQIASGEVKVWIDNVQMISGPMAADQTSDLIATGKGARIVDVRLFDTPLEDYEIQYLSESIENDGVPEVSLLDYVEQVLAIEPEYYWQFDKGDSSNVPNAGSQDAEIEWLGFLDYADASPVDGSTYAIYSGGNGYGRIPGNLSDIENDFSIECWVKYSTLASSSYGTIVAKKVNSSNVCFQLCTSWQGGGKLRIEIGVAGGIYGATTSQPFNDDEWHHVAAVRDGEAVRIYIDGALEGEGVAPLGPLDNLEFDAQVFRYGSYTTYRFEGLLDQLSICSKAISASEVASHAAQTVPGFVYAGAYGPYRQIYSGRPAQPIEIKSPLAIPNPDAISQSGRSSVGGKVHPQTKLARIDQLDGSGGNGTLTGGVSDPARMGVIAGTVLDIQAQPVSRRVRVHERATGRIVRETWSDADGKYRFTDLDPRRAFYVMAFDHTLQQNAVVSDNVHPELEDSP